MKFCRKGLSRPAENASGINVVFEELDSFYKRRVHGGHDHVYRIEILFAIETSGEVGILFDCGMEFSTQWAPKSKEIVSDSGFDVQQCYDSVDGDVVSEHSDKIIREVSFCHDRTSYGS